MEQSSPVKIAVSNKHSGYTSADEAQSSVSALAQLSQLSPAGSVR